MAQVGVPGPAVCLWVAKLFAHGKLGEAAVWPQALGSLCPMWETWAVGGTWIANQHSGHAAR